MPNKHKYPKQYAHDLVFLFYPFWDKSALLSECDETFTSKIIEQHALEAVNWNKLMLEPQRDVLTLYF